MKKKISINFSGFWEGLVPEETLTYKILCKHFDVEISEKPDYLFVSDYFNSNHFKYNEAIKIYYTGENIVPDFNLYDYGISFEYIEYGDRAFRLPLFLLYFSDLELCNVKHNDVDNVLKNKKDFCSFVYSNKDSEDIRTDLFNKLSEYKKVNSGGKYLNNCICESGKEGKLNFQKKHKFSIACENSTHPGYCTEKIVQSFAAQTIPIYWGDPKVKETFNEKAFINVNDYESLDDLVNRIKEIDNDDSLYISMLKEPAFVDKNYCQKVFEEYEKFLINIFSQTKENAFRRNMRFHGRYYQIYAKYSAKFIEKTRKIYSLFNK